jgi:hypothetical protein
VGGGRRHRFQEICLQCTGETEARCLVVSIQESSVTKQRQSLSPGYGVLLEQQCPLSASLQSERFSDHAIPPLF